MISKNARRRNRYRSLTTNEMEYSGVKSIHPTRLHSLLDNTDLSMTLPNTPLTELDSYVFVPPEVSVEIYLGTIVSLIPIVWATYEFVSRYN